MSQLAAACRRYADRQPEAGKYVTANPALAVMRGDVPGKPMPGLYEPALCVVAEGAKEALVGDVRLRYAAGQYVAITLDVPVTGTIAEAPYLVAIAALDLATLREVALSLPAGPEEPAFGLFVGQLAEPVADAMARLVDVAHDAAASRVLHPAIMRELCYHLLTGPEAPYFRHLAAPTGQIRRIGRSLQALREGFAAPLRVDRLAALAGMSESTYYVHFKAATGMAPLQYQKQLRLLEARRLLLAGTPTAAAAAHAVGYESPSQFSREYARMFGAPPRRDVAAAARS